MELFGSQFEMVTRLTVAVLMGLIVGAERSRVGKRAGMRTYALVSLGACLFVIISGMVSSLYANSFAFDPNRVLSQVVVGIGFLGAGVIYVQRQLLTGLTTAAGLWVVAGIGAACGYGFYMIAAYTTFLVLTVFEILWYVEARFIKTARFDTVTEQTDGSSVHKNGHEDDN